MKLLDGYLKQSFVVGNLLIYAAMNTQSLIECFIFRDISQLEEIKETDHQHRTSSNVEKNLKGVVYRAAKFILISLFFLFHQIYRLCCFGKVNLLRRMFNSLGSTDCLHFNIPLQCILIYSIGVDINSKICIC